MEVWLAVFAVGLGSALQSEQDLSTTGLVLENPEIVPGLFQGDIELRPGENPFLKSAIGDRSKLWPHGVLPYEISSSYPPTVQRVFHQAMQEIEEKTKVNGKTCIHFRPKTSSDSHYIYYGTGDGCHTHVGIGKQGRHYITIGHGCESRGIMMHETMHSLGFHHEQSRSDRDSYIIVHYDNIKDGENPQFAKMHAPEIDLQNEPYDYGSIMHYGMYAFAKDKNLPTITPKQRGVTIGQRHALSDIDVKDIQILYGCIPRPSGHTGGHVTNPPATSHPQGNGDYCSFSSGMCDWFVGHASQTKWQRHSGSTPSIQTGPTGDHHGSSSASYIYVEASGHTNQVAILNSKPYQGGEYCLQFYYNMYGSNMGSLYVNAVTAGGSVHRLKSFRGDHGDSWHHYSVHANVHTSHAIKFQFEGHTGGGSKSDIAIDDITVSHGAC